MQADIPLLFACMLVVGAGVWWFMRMVSHEQTPKDYPCDMCGRSTGLTQPSDAYYCSYECAAYGGDWTLRGPGGGWKINPAEWKGDDTDEYVPLTAEVMTDSEGRLVIVEED